MQLKLVKRIRKLRKIKNNNNHQRRRKTAKGKRKAIQRRNLLLKMIRMFQLMTKKY